MLSKHKVFLLLAKWIPVATAIGILINATLVYFNSPDAVNDLMSFTVGVSIAGIALMYSCSYAFNFCTWHRVVISYNASVMLLTFFNQIYKYRMWVLAAIVIVLHFSWRIYTRRSISSQQKNTNTTTKDERVT